MKSIRVFGVDCLAKNSLLKNLPKIYGLSKQKILVSLLMVIIIIIPLVLYGIYKDDGISDNDYQIFDKSNKISSEDTTQNLLNKIDNEQINSMKQESTIDSHLESIPPIVFNKKIESIEEVQSKQLPSKTLIFSNDPKRESQDFNVSNNISNVDVQYEIKAGSVIPATMINGINSDLPGEIIAIVRQNVYDSVNRKYLLIPQGTKIVGVYDSKIVYGQERVLVFFSRLIFPDGSSGDIGTVSGSDLNGYSGFYDKVDNKYWKIFGSSFVIGVITGGIEYSQNAMGNNTNNPNIQQTMSNGIGQQLGQTGLAITNKNLNVQPTLTIRPNYRFSIMLTKDIRLKPFKVIN